MKFLKEEATDMKMTYMKPRMIVERFTLTQCIATDCGLSAAGSSLGKPTSGNSTDCGWEVDGHILFMNVRSICTQQGQDNSVPGYCYNTPSPGMALFSSF